MFSVFFYKNQYVEKHGRVPLTKQRCKASGFFRHGNFADLIQLPSADSFPVDQTCIDFYSLCVTVLVTDGQADRPCNGFIAAASDNSDPFHRPDFGRK